MGNNNNISSIVYEKLSNLIENPVCELNFTNAFELIIAVVLSAQCTDKRVNLVTPVLFKKYPDCFALANANLEDLEKIIKSCGMYKTKAKHIKELAGQLAKDYNGQVPSDRERLESLSGVGRKTANVVLAVGFNIPAIPVDTHLIRVSNRLGLTTSEDPRIIEKDLEELFPKEKWNEIHHLLLLFGRYHCKAIKPNCENCVLCKYCKSPKFK